MRIQLLKDYNNLKKGQEIDFHQEGAEYLIHIKVAKAVRITKELKFKREKK